MQLIGAVWSRGKILRFFFKKTVSTFFYQDVRDTEAVMVDFMVCKDVHFVIEV